MGYKESYKRWLNSPRVSKEEKDILLAMNEETKEDAFFKDAEFGTAGMRGILGPGTNRINVHTIRKATIGFAMYLLEKYPNAKTEGVAISHDNRHGSREFTLLSAEILSGFGIKAYIFDSLRPTPELSFAVRELKCCGGIMITASHNPKEHNGYKVYDETGCQLVPDKIGRLLEIIASLPNELDVNFEPVSKPGEIVTINKDLDDKYISLVEGISLNPQLDKSKFKVVFTPNHGASFMPAMRVFNDLGYNIIKVEKQCTPDPDFSGTLSPNPEDAKSFIEPIKIAKEVNADLIVMTDPDGDRCGLGFKDKDGNYQTLTGNQSAPLLMDYIFSQRKEKGLLSKNGVMYDTIVTSSLGRQVAEAYGVKCEEFLTGFKYIGSRIDYYEKHGGPTFEFGYEESYGCLVAPFVRDKDATQAILLYTEMALFHYLKGKTLDVVWEEFSKRFGYHEDPVFNMYFEGASGATKMKEIMNDLRSSPIKELNGAKVVKVEDYKLLTSVENGKTSKIDLPVSDVIKLFFDDGSNIAIRPSGTEPKIKVYVGAVDKNKDVAKAKPKQMYDALMKRLGL